METRLYNTARGKAAPIVLSNLTFKPFHALDLIPSLQWPYEVCVPHSVNPGKENSGN